jgi:16S rRNA (cytosine967-C5)-methyltransferase
VTSVRLAAAAILLALERRRATLAAEVERGRRDIADPRDRALLLALTTGTVRWRQQLDALIAGASRRSVRTIDPRALAVLRLGVYQLRHLERVPAHAVVHESVEVVRALGAPRAAGFVNAVLRTVLRRGPALALPPRATAADPEATQLRYLSITLSHPTWLITRWLRRYGFDATERWCQFNNTTPDTSIRSVGGLAAAELIGELRSLDLDATPAPYAADAIRLPPGALGRVPAPLAASIQIQEEGAQLVARAVGARPGERVLDVCASPGGKALVCAADMRLPSPNSLLVAADLRSARVAVLAQTLERAGFFAPVVQHDARASLPYRPVFDAVVLDAPCSGLGTLRRDPDLKWSRTEGDLPALAAAERLMLEQAAGVVGPGGRLVYATCSSEPDENEAVAEAFLTGHPEFLPVPVCLDGPAAALVNARGHLATLPFRDGLDAFFAAIFVRGYGA